MTVGAGVAASRFPFRIRSQRAAAIIVRMGGANLARGTSRNFLCSGMPGGATAQMTIVLPNSVFFHIGRTGGHWVNHVLWRAGLIDKRLHPLHLTPQDVASDEDVSSRKNRFCFVRHPLDWAASVWRHEMEFGWSDSELSRAASADDFPSFLRKLLRAYPNGPCTQTMKPYLDGCPFVGKLERIAEDLACALSGAGEVFEAKCLAAPPLNQSSIPELVDACVAPLALLEEFLQAEAAFCKRFGYVGHDPKLIGEAPNSPWPRFASRQPVDPALPLARTRFTYQFDNDVVVRGIASEQRLQWSLIKAVRALKNPGRTAVVSEFDPYVAHLLASLGEVDLTSVPADERVTPRRINRHLAHDLKLCDFRSFHSVETDRPFDTVILVDSADISAAFEVELLSTLERIKPGGRLLIVAPILQTDLPLSTAFPANAAALGPRKLVYRSLGDWRAVLANCGFDDFSLLDRFDEAPCEARREQVGALADACGADPAHFLGKGVIMVRRTKDVGAQFESRELWLRRSVLRIDQAYDFLPAAVEGRILALEAEVQHERVQREKAEQGIVDREQELFAARRELHALAMELDHSRSLQGQALNAKHASQAELAELRALMRLLGVGSRATTELSVAERRLHIHVLADRDDSSGPPADGTWIAAAAG